MIVANLKMMRNFTGSHAVKLFDNRSDMRPTTKAENEPGGSILGPLEGASVDAGRPTSTELQ